MDSSAVLSNMVMPALFPMCTVMTELGYVLMGTSERNAILEVSPDGILVCSRNGDNCPHHTDTHVQASKATVHFEHMCNKSNVKPYAYTVPNYVILKIRCDMATMKTEQCVIGLKTYESVIFFKCTHDTHTWECLWLQLTDLYGKECLKKPYNLHTDTDFNRTALDFFSCANCEVICKVPLVKSTFQITDDCNLQGPFIHIGNIHDECINWDECMELVDKLKQEYKEIIKICHNLSRQKASEILAFNICDTDRFKLSNSDAYTNLIAYALKGLSLPILKLCAMLDDL